jgi:OOP family OmpA-OmpF porin
MKKLLTIAALLVATASAASAADIDPAVTDARGNPVRSNNGECVRFDFNSGNDICAPAPKPAPYVAPAPTPAPAPAPEPVAMLTKEELTVYFDFNKNDINPSEKLKLDNLITALISSKGVKSLSIVGYADRIGSTDANLKLSERRTSAVEKYLDAKVNIPTNVLQADARGETNSVTSCGEKEKRAKLISCLAADRRAEIVLNYLK